MATLLGEAWIRIRPDLAGFGGELDRGVKGSMSRLAGVAAGALAASGLGSALKQSLDFAAAAEQSVGAVSSIFKNYSADVVKRSKEAATSVGLSANSYRELATVVGSSLKNAGVPIDQLAGQTDGMIKKAADLNAIFGGGTEAAVQAMGAALRGEYDTIEKYGVTLTADAVAAHAVEMGLASSKAEVDDYGKKTAALDLINKQTTDSTGAFAREQGTASNAAEIAKAKWENLKTTVGERLLPAFTGFMTFVSDKVIPKLTELGTYIDTTVIPAFQGMGEWVQRNSDWILPLVSGIGAMVVAYHGYQAVMGTVAAVTRGYAAVQGILNAVMMANPIGLVVLALVGLGTALYVAYQKSETFRNIVDGAFRAVGNVADWLWTKIKDAAAWISETWTGLGDSISSKATEIKDSVISNDQRV